jgi:DNA polymerase V
MNDPILLSIVNTLPNDVFSHLDALMSDQPVYAAQSHFPSPCQGYEKSPVDMVREMIPNEPTTKLFPVEGYSMVGAGILHRSIVVVNTGLTAVSGSVIVAVVNGRFVVKQLMIENGEKRLYSRPQNHSGIPLQLGNMEEVHVWGVVTHAITSFI